jgi:hypothetical protein
VVDKELQAMQQLSVKKSTDEVFIKRVSSDFAVPSLCRGLKLLITLPCMVAGF